jgi:hypothetical protein
MSGHKLPNKTKSATVAEPKLFHQLNNPTIYHHLPLFYLTVTGYNTTPTYVQSRSKTRRLEKRNRCREVLHASHTSGDLSLLVLPRDRVRWQRTLAAPFFHGWCIHSYVLHIPDICWVTHVVDAINHQESHKTDDIDREVYNSISSLPTVRRYSVAGTLAVSS